ncbi:hypothetical protein FRC07_008714 [Ceratobasidium sp. 392]|nr:hypothetical protein FRC07_008714 [Ceratobasidium sp. 392]
MLCFSFPYHRNITQAQQAVNYTPPPSTTVSTSTSPTTASTPSLSRAAQSSTLPEQAPRSLAAPIAVVCVLALAIVLGMALWLYKRRNRVSPSTRPPPNFSIDDPATPLREPGHDRVGVGGEGSGGLSWWKKTIGKGKNGQDQRGNRSDPGKIDAWHYPFEYTPVSVDSSPGAGYPTGQPAQYLSPNGQGPGHYDPYLVGSMSRVTLHGEESDHEQRRRERQERRERRERRGLGSSETNLLAGRPSGETLRPSTSQGLHAQASHATLRYSPTPGSAPQQYAYNGVPPSYTPSNLQPGTGHSRSAAPSPTPGLFATPYVPPTTPTSHNRPGGHSPIPPSRHSPVPPGSLSPSPLPPSTSSQQHTYPQSPRAHAHTHTFEVQLSPTQYADLMNRYPEIRVRTRRHRRRDRDRDRDRDRASGDEGGVGEGRERRGRPRSWSVPAPPAPEDADAEEEDDTIDDGRPRNGPELTEKYRKRRRRRGTDADSRGKVLEAAGIVRERVVAGADSGRARALDGGVSLMGGPPPRVR